MADPRRADGGHLPAALGGAAAYGDFLDKDARHRGTGEFLQVVRAQWRGKRVDLDGEHVRVQDAFLDRLPDPVPPVYFGGSSPAAGRWPRHALLAGIDPPASRRCRGRARAERVGGQRRIRALHGGSVANLEVSSNL